MLVWNRCHFFDSRWVMRRMDIYLYVNWLKSFKVDLMTILIDFEEIPNTIKDSIINAYKNCKIGDKTNLYKYLKIYSLNSSLICFISIFLFITNNRIV